jgi:hypothetical protein
MTPASISHFCTRTAGLQNDDLIYDLPVNADEWNTGLLAEESPSPHNSGWNFGSFQHIDHGSDMNFDMDVDEKPDGAAQEQAPATSWSLSWSGIVSAVKKTSELVVSGMNP